MSPAALCPTAGSTEVESTEVQVPVLSTMRERPSRSRTAFRSVPPARERTAASSLLSALASTIPAIRPARYLSLFYWSAGNDQISQGVTAADYAVLTAAGLCALTAAVTAFNRTDLN